MRNNAVFFVFFTTLWICFLWTFTLRDSSLFVGVCLCILYVCIRLVCDCQLLCLQGCVIMCVWGSPAPVSFYWCCCLQNFICYFPWSRYWCCVSARKPMHICVCALCIGAYLLTWKASSRSPSHFQNSRHALILILPVIVLLLWSEVALGEYVDSEVPTELPRWTPWGHNSRLLVLWRDMLWRDDETKDRRTERRWQFRTEICAAEMLTRSPDHNQWWTFTSCGLH